MLRRVYIDNYRCFSNFELRPGRVNLLLGPNGSGKSSLFDVLVGIIRLVRSGRSVSDVFPVSSRTRWDERTGQRFELDVDLDGTTYSYALDVEHDLGAGDTAIARETVRTGDKTLFNYSDRAVHLHRNDGSEGTSFPFRASRSFLAEMEARPENAELMKLLDYLDGARSVKLVPSGMASVSHDESGGMRSDGADFASWYRHLAQERPEELHGLFTRLCEVIPGFKSLVLAGAGKQGRARDLMVRLSASSGAPYEVDFEDLSDGQRVLVVLYTLLLDVERRAGLLLLDEPENYLSLAEVQPWLVALDDALGDAGQLLLISHHPGVIDYLAAEQPVSFSRDGVGPVRVSDPGFERGAGLLASEQIARGLADGG